LGSDPGHRSFTFEILTVCGVRSFVRVGDGGRLLRLLLLDFRRLVVPTDLN
jgi:hypothetical protein